MPILFVGPSGVIEVSLTPIGQVDRIEKKAQELADECQVRLNVYYSDCGDDLERATLDLSGFIRNLWPMTGLARVQRYL